MTEEQEQGTPQQRMGGEAEPSKDLEDETAEDTGGDSPAGREQQAEEEYDDQ